VGVAAGGVLHYEGGATEANHVTVSFDWWHDQYLLQDTGAVIASPPYGSQCSSSDPHTVRCAFGSVKSVSVQLGGGGSYARNALELTPVTFTGGAGNDTLVGGAGPATLVASGGNDTIVGGSGAETINSRDGVAEQVSCGAGVDSVTADPSDTVAADCENVDRGAAPPATSSAGGPSGAGALSAPPVTLQLPAATVATPPTPVTMTSSSTVPVPVYCPATAVGGCHGTVVLTLAGSSAKGRIVAARREKGHALGRTRKFKIAAGQKAVVPVRLSRRGARIFKARRGGARKVLKLTATVTTRSEAGVGTSTRVITVTAARRRPTPAHRSQRRQTN
jgi:hypothetical protein